jgi:hypothetical protein
VSELHDRLNTLAGRGAPRGVDAVFDEATRIAGTTDEAEVDRGELDPIPFVTAEPTRKRRRPMSSLIAATGTLTLLMVSMLAVGAFLGSGGANSPEGAVRKLADAISHEDPLAAADVMAPSEVQSLHGTLDAASKRAAELALVKQAGAPLSGLDFNVDDLTMTTEQLGENHAKVRIQGGAIRARTEHENFSPLVQRSLGEPSTNEGSIDLANGWDDGNELFVMAVREDGDWYISAAYTTLEYIRVSGDAQAAEFGSGVTNIATLGADTPQAAVENGMRALQASDWAGLIALADPKELPLYDYRAALTELATRDEMRTDFTITSMATTANVSGDTAKVRLTASGKTNSGDTWSLDGGCFTPPASGYSNMDRETVPQDEVPPSCVGNRFGIGYGLLYGYGSSDESGGVSEITVVERNGRWFVSPVGTALDILDTWIANMDQRTLYVLLQQPEQLPPDGRLTLGTPVTLPSTMGNWGAAVYEFDGKAGQEVVAHFPADDDDPSAWSYNAFILNPDGSYVSDGAMPIYGNTVELPADGTYRIVLTTYFGEQTEFTLWDAKDAPAAALKNDGSTCTYEGGGSTSCSSASGDFGSETYAGEADSANGELGVGETMPGSSCTYDSNGGKECTAEAVAVPTSIP